MKNHKHFYILTLFFSIAFLLAGTIHAQKLDRNKVENMVTSKHFVFKPQTMIPTSGMVKQLTFDYDLRIMGDSISTYLPYFGRSYEPIAPGEEGGVNFNSSNFSYKVEPRKKGGWDIIILPKDTKDVRQLFFTISPDGFASLQIISNSKQAISYTGYIANKK